jgi:hypothetical protein
MLALLWSLAWFGIRREVATRMDATAAQAVRAGYTLNWRARGIGGYPVRIEAILEQPRLGEPSGWSLAAPELDMVANAYDLNHWVIAAPHGLTLTRPGAGATQIAGRAIRASWVGLGRTGSRIAFEGLDLTFAPAPGAKPFPLARAASVTLYTRPAPGGVEARFMVYDGRAAPGGRFGDLTGQASVALVWQGVVRQAAAFRGADAPDAARAWSAAGGAITTELGGMAAGPRMIGVRSSRLTVDADGRLSGHAALQIKGGGEIVRVQGGGAAPSGDAWAPVDLGFRDGRTRLGALAIAPAPKLF